MLYCKGFEWMNNEWMGWFVNEEAIQAALPEWIVATINVQRRVKKQGCQQETYLHKCVVVDEIRVD